MLFTSFLHPCHRHQPGPSYLHPHLLQPGVHCLPLGSELPVVFAVPHEQAVRVHIKLQPFSLHLVQKGFNAPLTRKASSQVRLWSVDSGEGNRIRLEKG